MKKKTSLEEIKTLIKEQDANLRSKDKEFHYAVIMLSSALNRLKTTEELHDFTRFQLRECYNCVENLKKNGLGWQGKRFMHSGWDDEESGGIAFWLDVSIAMGYIERAQKGARK